MVHITHWCTLVHLGTRDVSFNGTHWFRLVNWFTMQWYTMVHIGGTGGGCRRQLKVCFSSWWELWEEYRTRKLGAGRKVKSKDKEKTKKDDKKKKNHQSISRLCSSAFSDLKSKTVKWASDWPVIELFKLLKANLCRFPEFVIWYVGGGGRSPI